MQKESLTKCIRVIPCLGIKGPNLVKGIHLEGLRVLGKPENFARYYYETGADELIYIDMVASLYNRNSVLGIIEKTAREISIPLTVGGGLRTIDDIREALRAGADKVALNTAAIKNPSLIKEAAKIFGSSTIVIAIEAIRQPNGSYLAFIDNGREYTGVEVLQWAIKATELGAGEILLIAVDREGTGEGYDVELIKMISETVPIPVIALGGAGKNEHVKEAIIEGKADAVSCASILHYDFIQHNRKKEDFSSEGNVSYLMSGLIYSKVVPTGLKEIKKYLIEQCIKCRPAENL